MTDRLKRSGTAPDDTATDPRKARLKAALQANIARRKQQARTRAEEGQPAARLTDDAHRQGRAGSAKPDE